jgi:transcriptional regulator with XRE-family HTH domain
MTNARTTPTRVQALEDLRVNVVVGRAHARLSQVQLAERAGVSRPTVSRIERGSGDVGIEVVQRIADALGVTVASLFEPVDTSPVDDAEIARRAADPPEEFSDLGPLLAAIDEANSAPEEHRERRIQRYSRAGRPPLAH